MNENFKNLPSEDRASIEKQAELSGKLNYDDEEIKYEGEKINTQENSPRGVPEASEDDIEKAHTIQKQGKEQTLIQENTEKKSEREALRKKYARQVIEFAEMPKLHTKVNELKKEERDLVEKERVLLDTETKIEEALVSKEWKSLINEKSVIEEIMRTPIDFKKLENSRAKDTLIKAISFGLLKPSAAMKFINQKAEKILLDQRQDIMKEIFSLGKRLTEIEIEKTTKSAQLSKILDFQNTPEWTEFEKIENLQNDIDKNLKKIRGIEENTQGPVENLN